MIDLGEIDLDAIEDQTWVSERIKKYFQRIEKDYPFVLIDLGTLSTLQSFVLSIACPELMFVITPAPEARAQCYAAIKSMLNSNNSFREASIALLVNMAERPDQALLVAESITNTARKFLNFDLSMAGYVPLDQNVSAACERKLPLLEVSPDSPASKNIKEIVDWIYTNRPPTGQIGISEVILKFFNLLIEIQNQGERDG